MLDQPIQNLTQTQAPLNQPTLTPTPQAIQAPAAVQSNYPTPTQNVEYGFNVEVSYDRLPPDMCIDSRIDNGNFLIATHPGGETTIQLKKLVIKPLMYVPYKRMQLDDDESNLDIAYSYNNVTEIEGVEWDDAEYLNKVRENHPDAKWSNRGMLVGRYIEATTVDGNPLQLNAKDLILVNLSPTSARAWSSLSKRFVLNQRDNVPMGNCVELTPLSKRNTKGKSWTQFAFNDVYFDVQALVAKSSQVTNQPALAEQAA